MKVPARRELHILRVKSLQIVGFVLYRRIFETVFVLNRIFVLKKFQRRTEKPQPGMVIVFCAGTFSKTKIRLSTKTVFQKFPNDIKTNHNNSGKD